MCTSSGYGDLALVSRPNHKEWRGYYWSSLFLHTLSQPRGLVDYFIAHCSILESKVREPLYQCQKNNSKGWVFLCWVNADSFMAFTVCWISVSFAPGYSSASSMKKQNSEWFIEGIGHPGIGLSFTKVYQVLLNTFLLWLPTLCFSEEITNYMECVP